MGSIFSIQHRMFFEVGQNCQFHFLIRRMGKCSIEVDSIVILIQYNLFNTRGCPFKFERGKALTRELLDKNFTNRLCFFVLLCFLFLFCLTEQPVAFRRPPVVSIVLLFDSVNRGLIVNTFNFFFLVTRIF